MAGGRALEAILAELAELREEPDPERREAALRRALGHRSSHAVARAAALAGELGLAGLLPELEAALARLLARPARADPGCRGKTAVVRTLLALEIPSPTLLRRGLRHVQMEPVWGKSIDTAGELRGACALGLVGDGSAEVLAEVAELLADPEPPARISAARALGDHGSPHGAAPLRLKVLLGDDEPGVITECLGAILHLDAEEGLAFVTGRLVDPAQTAAAAVALGESGLEAALEALQTCWEGDDPGEVRRAALQGIALCRRDEALGYLVGIARHASGLDARAAVQALLLRREEPVVREGLEALAEARQELAREIRRGLEEG